MSTSSLAAASVLNAGQSPLLSLNPTKHRKHPSMSDAPTQSVGAQAPLAASGQPGSKINITA
jgi:hypothetical protein